MSVFQFKHVHIESIAVNLPPIEVTSAQLEDRLAPLYKRLSVPFGSLERLSGISTRYFWDMTVTPSQAATGAAKKAVEAIGFDRSHIASLINCSVTRDHFEPATAMLVHKALGLKSSSMAFDISNACLGISNGMMIMGNMIESGLIKAGVLTSGETISRIVETSIQKMLASKDIDREQLLKLLPTFTLGSGAVSIVMCHESIATKPHKFLGGASQSASEFADLCVGNADFCYYMDEADMNPLMETDSPNLIGNGAIVGSHTWKEMQQAFGWDSNSYDVLVSHQVGRQLGDKFFNTVGIDNKKEFTIYQKYGNQVSAALPTTLALAVEQGVVKPGSTVLCTAFGSGLNSIFSAIKW